ncbi:MAG: site-specific integrase, partial [Longimicrobiales bacterium]|nr:site-specific integrase [Longimicrobiales bacterium]
SPVEANRCLETLRAAWSWADRHELLPEGLRDPTRRVERFRERSRDRWLRRGELERLMDATRKEDDPHAGAAIPLLLLTGLRKGELLSARWEDVDLERGEIRLPETKSGEAQVRLLPSPAVEILRNLPRYRESPFVFPSPTDPRVPRKDIKPQWQRIRTAAGLEDVTLHDLRRTAGSFMAQAGVPLQVIQHVLGHAHPAVTKLYARLASQNEREALETLAGELRGILGNGKKTDPEPGPTDDLRNRLEALLEEGARPEELVSRLRGFLGELEENGS